MEDVNKNEILKLVKELDLGISDIHVESADVTIDDLPDKLPDELKKIIIKNSSGKTASVKILHRKFDSLGDYESMEEFDLGHHESEGTQKLFALTGVIITTIKEAEIIIIDELDARLHPLISQAIVKLFNSNETNPNNAQLIFMTHDTNLLSNKLFRRDQIWFTEKNRYGATDLYSLAEYNNIRNDASFESDYIKGRYGAIPYLGNLSNLVDIHG